VTLALSPFDDPILSGLVGDDDVASLFTPSATIAAMVRFELALSRASAAEGFVPEAAVAALERACATFAPDVDALRQGTMRDGVVVPELVRQLRMATGEPQAGHVHKGATSQDVIDTALTLRLAEVASIVRRRLRIVDGTLGDLVVRFGDRSLTARTRMRRAMPIVAGDRIAAWRSPLLRHRNRLDETTRDACVLQLGGAAGNLGAFEGRGPAIAARMGAELGLRVPERSWHSQRDEIVALAGVLAMIAGSVGKIGQDIALMAQEEVGEVTLASGGGSSAMPGKVNPIGAEVVVALARFAAAQMAVMTGSLVHEQERSGAAWTAEWLVFPQICAAAAGSLAALTRLLGDIDTVGAADA